MAKEYKVITLKNGEKRYQFDVSLGYDASGNRMRTTIRTKTIKEGRQKVAELTLKEKNTVDKGVTLEKAYKLYLSDCEAKGMSKNTIQCKKTAYKHFSAFAQTCVYRISDKDLVRWQNELKENNSDASVKSSRAMFSAFMNWCVKKKIISENPFKYVDGVKYKAKEKDFWTYQEFQQFMQYVPNDYKLFFQLLFFCGLRKGEALALYGTDFDRDKHEIHIQRNLINLGSYFEYRDTLKTDKSRRIVPYPAWLDIPDTNEPIFLKTWYKSIYDVFSKAINESGVKRILLHDIRHSYVSMLIEKGVDLFTISKLVGHSNIQITSSIYAHLYDNKMQEIQSIFNKLE